MSEVLRNENILWINFMFQCVEKCPIFIDIGRMARANVCQTTTLRGLLISYWLFRYKISISFGSVRQSETAVAIISIVSTPLQLITSTIHRQTHGTKCSLFRLSKHWTWHFLLCILPQSIMGWETMRCDFGGIPWISLWARQHPDHSLPYTVLRSLVC